MSHPALSNVDEVESLLKLSRNTSDIQFLMEHAPSPIIAKAILNIIEDLQDTAAQLASYRSDSFQS